MVDIEEKKDNTNSRWSRLLRLTAGFILSIIIFAVLVLCSVFGIYWDHFHNLPLSADPAKWGVFGDFIGGTANPILSFLTIVLLAFTLLLQTRQLSMSSKQLRLSRKELELSRKELELTRAELQRTAEAQELSEKALRAQAETAEASTKLAAINALLENCSREIARHDGLPKRNSFHELELERLQNRYRTLKGLLDVFYHELIGLPPTNPSEEDYQVYLSDQEIPQSINRE